MLNKVQTILKKVVMLLIVSIFVVQAAASVIQYAKSSSLLGTNRALGSPLLSNDFNNSDWNKWEFVIWGIFLSNFVTPIIDDYKSAFDVSSEYGSKGSGYKALVFGTGSDAITKDTIDSLLETAIIAQTSGSVQEIYVDYKFAYRDRIGNISKEDFEETEVHEYKRRATLRDLFLTIDGEDGESFATTPKSSGMNTTAKTVPIERDNASQSFMDTGIGGGITISKEDYMDIVTVEYASLPVFSVNDETLLDYSDGWDAQVMIAWINRTMLGDYAEEFVTVFSELWGTNGKNAENYNLYLDCFGNIVIYYNGSYRVVVPASINQHLTNTPKINLLSSMLFNGFNSGLSKEHIALQGRQVISGWFNVDKLFGLIDTTDVRFGGLPAFGCHISDNKQGGIYFYYDLDSIAYDNYFNGGSVSAGGDKLVWLGGNEMEYAHYLDYGRAVEELFKQDFNNYNKYMFKIEAANLGKAYISNTDDSLISTFSNMVVTAGQIANIAGPSNAEILTEIITDKDRVPLFDDSVVIPVQMETGGTPSKLNATGVAREYINYIYDLYREKETFNGESAKQDVIDLLSQSKTAKEFRNVLLGKSGGDKVIHKVLANYIYRMDRENRIDIKVDKELIPYTIYSGSNIFKELDDLKINGEEAFDVNYSDDGNLDYFGCRLVKLYPISSVLKLVGNYLGVREGTDFGAYSTFIYMTYLDWYGIKKNKVTGEYEHGLNEFIFQEGSDILSIDIDSVLESKSDVEKEKEILDYTYLMLNPTAGREYRNKINNSAFSDFIYNTYEKIVNGNSSDFYYANNENLATRNSSGFLRINTYSENFMTSWFVKIYSKIAIIIVGVSFILVVVIGLIKNRKASWFVIALVLIINSVLITPSSGEVVPLVLNTLVQNMFSDKMTYWALSESVENQTLEGEFNSRNGTSYFDSDREVEQALNLIKSLNVIYLDRALMVKRDISTKVNSTSVSNYTDIQELKSARWLLPIIMNQFSADDGSAEYVYTSLASMYDDASNLYWYYKPLDAAVTDTVNARKEGIEGEPIFASSRSAYYPDYVNTLTIYDTDGAYKSEAYVTNTYTLESMPHTYFYLLDSVNTLLPRSIATDVTTKEVDFHKYAEESLRTSTESNFVEATNIIENEASTYVSSDRNTMEQCFGYLWATESTYPYFYQAIKDTFESDISLGSLIGKIQGQYVKNDSGDDVRINFMYSGKTGKIKDVLDLEELFTNLIPYLYQMQITAGGFDGESGVLGDAKIENYELYKSNNKSWLFRSNWVTKIMESKTYSKGTTVRDSNGVEHYVSNPLLVECYPSERPMVFSEAQMEYLGLSEVDLNSIELRCVEINKEVAKDWTLLLNYVGTPGLTKEALYRQMAINATLIFNNSISPSGILNNYYKLYPNGIDLRSISFDSVMRLLMLNATRNTSYAYSSTMKNVVEYSDIFTATLLLISAFLCAFIIPLIRDVAMGLIFFLGFVSILYSLMSSAKQKVKISFGQVISNVIFILATLVYYAVFNALMAITTKDNVLSVVDIQVNAGNPVWCFIAVIIASLAYTVAIYKLIVFCFRHYRDMGFEMYATIASSISGAISKGIGVITGGVFNKESAENNVSGTNTLGVSGSVDGSEETTINNRESIEQDVEQSYNESGYTEDTDIIDEGLEEMIDSEIRRGGDSIDTETSINAISSEEVFKSDTEINSDRYNSSDNELIELDSYESNSSIENQDIDSNSTSKYSNQSNRSTNRQEKQSRNNDRGTSRRRGTGSNEDGLDTDLWDDIE